MFFCWVGPSPTKINTKQLRQYLKLFGIFLLAFSGFPPKEGRTRGGNVVQRLRPTLGTDPNSPTWWDYSAIVDTTKKKGTKYLSILSLRVGIKVILNEMCAEFFRL